MKGDDLVTTHVCSQAERIAGIEHDVSNLIRWQKDQNGSIFRVEKKVDKLIFWFMTFAITSIGGLGTALVLFLLNK